MFCANRLNGHIHHIHHVNTSTQTGATPLHWASLANATGVIDFLAERGADPNLANTVNGQTPFHWAVINGNVEAAHRLIEVGGALAGNCGRWQGRGQQVWGGEGSEG